MTGAIYGFLGNPLAQLWSFSASSLNPPPSFNVRIFGHAGIQRIPQVLQPQLSGNTTEQLSQPYIWSQVVTVPTVAFPVVSSSIRIVPDIANMVVIEVPDGQTIRLEFNSPQRIAVLGAPVVAGANSKLLSGVSTFSWMPGTTLSMVSAALFP